jgi:hypothetical protein
MTAFRRYIALGLVVVLAAGLRLAWLALTWSPEGAGPAAGRSAPTGRGRVPRIRRTAPPAEVPDLHQGYIFSPDRVLDPAAAAAFGGGGETTGAETGAFVEGLRYDGSIIVGDVRRALVSFPATRRDPETGRDVKVTRNQVIEQGDEFRGYLVEAVEPLRLVLSRDGERVIKPLYDKNKERPAAAAAPEKKAGKRAAAPPVRAKAPSGAASAPVRPRPVSAVLVPPRPVRGAAVPVNKAAAGKAGTSPRPRELPRSVRRLERLRMAYPDIVVPPAGGAVPPAKAPSR